MRVSTITCHDVYNYGASLQAYALQKYCESLGHDYRIINYKPPYLSNHFRLNAVSNLIYNRPIIKYLYLLAKLPSRLRALKQKRAFDAFTASYLRLTDTRFASNEEIASSCPKADLFIAGSDQIWNTLFKNGKDAAFYLDFVKDNSKRISYAASFATNKIFDGYEDFIKEKLTKFDEISVRETSGQRLLNELGFTKSVVVCDPVFLLNRDEWQSMLSPKLNFSKKYILVYDCERSRNLREIALKLKEYTNLDIFTVSSVAGSYADRSFKYSGPQDFITLIANADYVIANSFHALAFSLIFRKKFFITNRSEGINTRMHDFLAELSISDRLIDSSDGLNLNEIPFNEIDPKLDRLIKTSKEFLNRNLS